MRVIIKTYSFRIFQKIILEILNFDSFTFETIFENRGSEHHTIKCIVTDEPTLIFLKNYCDEFNLSFEAEPIIETNEELLKKSLQKMVNFHEINASYDKGDNGYYTAKRLLDKLN